MTEIVTADIGGTHARFAVAEVEGGKVARLDHAVTLRTGDFDGLRGAWAAFGAALGRPLPTAAAIGVAAPISGDELRFVNSDWVIGRSALAADIGVSRLTLVNDFGAMAHAVAALDESAMRPLCGPDVPLPADAPVTVIGPGTGLGCAILLRRGGRLTVIETEASHIGFAPRDAAEDALLSRLRGKFGRVSSERIVSGPGLANLDAALGGGERARSDAELWNAALSGGEPLAAAAADRFVSSFGAVTGDVALAHGAFGVAVVGGLANRIFAERSADAFHAGFIDKGRYTGRMQSIPVKLVTHPQPGLYGAAAAFAEEHR